MQGEPLELPTEPVARSTVRRRIRRFHREGAVSALSRVQSHLAAVRGALASGKGIGGRTILIFVLITNLKLEPPEFQICNI